MPAEDTAPGMPTPPAADELGGMLLFMPPAGVPCMPAGVMPGVILGVICVMPPPGVIPGVIWAMPGVPVAAALAAMVAGSGCRGPVTEPPDDMFPIMPPAGVAATPGVIFAAILAAAIGLLAAFMEDMVCRGTGGTAVFPPGGFTARQ